ncbi:DUF6461 domain-containing protein [Streptomyces sp. NPDC003247]|uniref:DUF6461 domain-containing protein n=1 Tax=Streptomyces sp. NPDC003247 TaxID=3364677 RepID=UPI0036CB5ABF
MDLGSNPWEWATDSRYPVFCLTFTRGSTPDAVLGAYGVAPGQAAIRTQAESGALLPRGGGGTLLRVGTLAENWVYCYEDLEPEGLKPTVMARLSQGTETVRVFKGADGLRTLDHYRDGRRTESVELSTTPVVRGEGPHTLASALRQALGAIPATASSSGSAPSVLLLGLDVAGRYVGGVLDAQTLRGPLLTAFLPDADRAPLRPVRSPPTGSPSQTTAAADAAAAKPGRPLGVLPPAPRSPGSHPS